MGAAFPVLRSMTRVQTIKATALSIAQFTIITLTIMIELLLLLQLLLLLFLLSQKDNNNNK